MALRRKRPISVCTWSLQNDLFLLEKVLHSTGINQLHLAMEAIQGTSGEAFSRAITDLNWTISCTMMGFPQEDYSTLESIRLTGGIMPDECWERNRTLALNAIEQTATLGVSCLSTHAGFIDHGDEPAYRKFCDRMLELANAAKDNNISLLMETGQESAADLKQCLEDLDHPAIGVNFDPANMILYGKGDPIEAIHILAPWIRHVHVKDANPSVVPDEWGQEVPWGEGQVNPSKFLSALDEIAYHGPLAIEREAGNNRVCDISRAAEMLHNS